MARVTLKVSELLEGRPKRVEIEGRGCWSPGLATRFTLSGIDVGCSLSEGTLQATIVTCPCHGSKFDITNGKVVAWVEKYSTFGKLTSFMKRDEPVFSVTVEGDEIMISS